MKIVVLILLINFLTCALVRVSHDGRLIETPSRTNKLKLYRLAGLLNQPDTAFSKICFPATYETVDLRFSLLGFDPRAAGRQLERLLGARDLAIGISLGVKPLAESRFYNHFIFVNPCTSPEILKPNLRKLITTLSPLAEGISYVLGWLAVLPLIPADSKTNYSLALLIDQLYSMGYYAPKNSESSLLGTMNTDVIISKKDEFLLNDEIKKLYTPSCIIEIDTFHARIADPSVSDLYEDAILSLLK